MKRLNELIDEDQNLRRILEIVIRLGLILGLIIWCFNIVSPFIPLILWGGIIAVAVYPFQLLLLKRLPDRRLLAATSVTLLLLFALIVPSVMLSTTMVESGGAIAEKLSDDSVKIPAPPESIKDWPIIGKKLDSFWQLASRNLEEALAKLKPQFEVMGKWLLKAAAGAGITILQFLFSILIAGAFLFQAEISNQAARKIAARIAGTQGDTLVSLTVATIRSVAQGVLGIALIQSILSGLGMLVVGVPAAGLWALLVLILAVVQLPPTLVLIPVIAYVFYDASTVTAVIFAVYATFVATCDTWLKPLLLGRGVETPMLVVLLGAIGGMITEGVIGLFIGAVVLSLGYKYFIIWLDVDAQENPSEDVEDEQASLEKS